MGAVRKMKCRSGEQARDPGEELVRQFLSPRSPVPIGYPVIITRMLLITLSVENLHDRICTLHRAPAPMSTKARDLVNGPGGWRKVGTLDSRHRQNQHVASRHISCRTWVYGGQKGL